METLLALGGVVCAVGTYLIGDKLKEIRLAREVDKRIKELTEKEDSKEDGDN